MRIIQQLFAVLLLTAAGCHGPSKDSVKAPSAGKLTVTEKTQIAFACQTDGIWQVWRMNPDGQGLKQITRSPVDKRCLVWSSDNQGIFFSTTNDQLFYVDIQSGQEKQVFESADHCEFVVPSPLNDKYIVVRFNNQFRDDADLWIASAFDGKLQVLFKDKGYQSCPSWSPNGKDIVYVHSQGYRSGEIFTLNTETRARKQLTENKYTDGYPAYSPQGDKIAYISDRTEDFEIWLMNADGGNQTQLTDNPGLDSFPTWSPDGKKILFISGRTGSLDLWMMDSDGKNQTPLTQGKSCMYSTWQRTTAK